MKIDKMGVYLLWGSFEVENESVCSLKPTGSIAKVLTDVHEKFSQKRIWNSGSPKYYGL